MRIAAAIPAIGILAGSAAGLLLPEFPSPLAFAVLAVGAGAAIWSWHVSRVGLLAGSVGLSFLAGGLLLAADAWHAARRPSLRLAFEERATRDREQAPVAGSRPEDDTVFAFVTGVVRADASLRANGVSLSVDVRSIDTGGPDSSGRASAETDTATRGGRLFGPADAAALKGPRHKQPEIALGASTEMPVRGGVLLNVAGTLSAERITEWRAGRVIRLPAQLRRPSRYLDPGVADQEQALARGGTTLVGSVKSGALVEVVERGGWPAETAASARAFARRAIASAVGRWSTRSAAIVAAIIVGDRSGLDDEVQRRLQEAGTYHVLAISGGNIAILAGLALAGFRAAGLLGRVAMLSAVAALLGYGYLVGGGASVNRATLMAVVYFAARAIDLRGPPMNLLALAAGVLVAVQPLAVFDPGFLLTFGATLAILAAVPAPPPTRPRPLAALATMLAASLAAEIFLLPISAFVFSRVTFAGPLANFAAIPLMGVVQIAGIVAVAAAPVSATLASAAGWVAHIAAEGLVRSADVVTLVPALTWRVAPPHWVAIVAYYFGLIVGWTLWRFRASRSGARAIQDDVARRVQGDAARAFQGRELTQSDVARPLQAREVTIRRVANTVAIAAGLWIVGEPWIGPSTTRPGRLRVTFIDVGQGDAALVQFPGGATTLIDAGGLASASSFDIGDRVVAPVLRDAGVRRLDTLAVTHGDLDHAGGAASIVREFRPRDIWEGIPVPRHALMRDLRHAAGALGARWANVQTGDRLVVDDVLVAVRHPRLPDWERQDVRNDDSIVIELLWRDASIVLTGDIGRDVEREIAPLFSPSPLRVVKVPHHGSLTSSTRDFVRTIAPRVAVVSVGRGNSFGHPAPEVLETYRQLGVQIFRTDQDGAVTVDTDGHSLEITTFTGQRMFVRPRP